MGYRSAIFDMDGTLLDSMGMWRNVGRDYLLRQGVNPPEDLPDRLRTLSFEQAAQFFQREFGILQPLSEIVEEIQRIPEEQYRLSVPLKPGAKELLLKLQEKGVPMCVATETDRVCAEAALQRLDVIHCFSFLLSCKDLGKGKNDPAVYVEAAKRLGSEPGETLVLEDCLYCAKTAKKAGFPVAAVYDDASASDWEQMQRICDRSVMSLIEVKYFFIGEKEQS